MKYSTLTFPDIYRITLPYKDIFTTVALIGTPEGYLMLDAASYDADVSDVILPALEELGITKDNLKYLVISHSHIDHAGGLGAFLKAFPNVTVLSRDPKLPELHPDGTFCFPQDGDTVLGCLSVVAIPGHTMDAMGILDTRTGTLVSGDALQQYGIFGSGKWGSNIRFPGPHREAVKRLFDLPVNGILSAHDFHPVGQFAHTRQEAHAFFAACLESLDRIEAFGIQNDALSFEEIAAAYNKEGTLPTVGKHVFEALKKLRDGQ